MVAIYAEWMAGNTRYARKPRHMDGKLLDWYEVGLEIGGVHTVNI